MKHREYTTWQVWLDNQWNEPNRGDHYLMRIAQAIGGKKGSKLEKFKILFEIVEGDGKPKRPKGVTKEQVAAWSRAKWLAITGGTKKIIHRIRYISKDDEDAS